MPKTDAKREHNYVRVMIMYTDGESSGNRVFKDRARAERWVKRQKKSPVVKAVKFEPFVRRPYEVAKVRSGPNPTSNKLPGVL